MLKFRSVQSKILVMTLGIVISILIILSIIFVSKTRESNLKTYNENSNEQLKLVSQNIYNFYDQIDKDINMVAEHPLLKKADSTITTYKDTNEDTLMTPSQNGGLEQEIFEMFDHYADTHPGTSYVYLGLEENGGHVIWPEYTINQGYDPRVRPWYELSIDMDGKIMRTDPYEDSVTKELVISNTRSFTNNDGEVIGVLGIDVQQSSISEMLSEMKTGETGFSMIVHESGVIMADGNNSENNFENISDVEIDGLEKLISGETEDFNVEINGETYLVNPYKVEGTAWFLASLISEKELKKQEREIIKTVTIAIVVIFILVSLLVYISSKNITVPLKKLSKHLNIISKGDFSKPVDEVYINRNDEIGVIASAIKNMQSQLRGILNNMKNYSNTLDEYSSNLHEIIEQSAETMSEVASSIQHVSEGASEQAKDTEKISNNIRDLSNQIDETSNEIKNALEISTKVSVLELDGSKTMDELREKTNLNKEKNDEISKEINEVNDATNKITEIIRLITNIAEQTNLLALNASIEAARAGEAGKGFAVVAEEIRKLAEDTTKAIKEIEGIIIDITEKSSNAVSSVEKITSVSEEQNLAIDNTIEVFNKIGYRLEELSKNIERISKSSELISKSKENIVGAIEDISVVVEEESASSQEVSASVEEQLAGLEEIKSRVGDTKEIADLLKDTANKFKF